MPYLPSFSNKQKSVPSILTLIEPFIIISQLLGLTLFTINSRTWRAEIKKFNIFIAVAVLLVHIFLHYIFWSSYFNFFVDGTEVGKSAIPKLIYVTVITHFVGKIWNFINRQKLVNFLRQLHEIDETFKDLHVYFEYKNERKKLIKFLFGDCALVAVMSIFGAFIHLTISSNMDPAISILSTSGNIWGSVVMIQFGLCIVIIKQRYEAINKFLDANSIPKSSDLKALSEIHLMVTESIEIFNSVNGPLMMVWFGIAFGWLCMFIFITLMMPRTMWIQYTFTIIFNILLHSVMFLCICFLIYYIEWTKTERKKGIKLLYRILNKTDCGLLRKKLLNMIWQISETKLEFSCGLLDFNWKFLFQYVTAIIMYFIILVQFETSVDKNKGEINEELNKTMAVSNI